MTQSCSASHAGLAHKRSVCIARHLTAGNVVDPISTACRQIIEVNLTSEDFKPIVPGAEIEFTYSVRWAPTATPFARRFERYLDYKFFGHQARRGVRNHARVMCEGGVCGLPLR